MSISRPTTSLMLALLLPGDLAATTKRFHASRFDYYGKRRSADGLLLGERPTHR